MISIILGGCWTTPPIPPEPPADEPVYRALFVGVGDYIFFSVGVDLPSPPYNVESLKQTFRQCRFGEDGIEFTTIKTLVDWQATKENILDGILDTFAGADDDDVSYFYYMGHGGVAEGIPVITGSDTKMTLETSITVHELEEHLNMISGTKVVFIESCHSGNFIGKNDFSDDNFNDAIIDIFNQNSLDLLNKENYQVLASSTGEQYTWTHGSWSYFCKALLEGCEDLNADTNEDEIVNLTEIHNYVVEWIEENCPKDQDSQIYPEGSIFPIVEY